MTYEEAMKVKVGDIIIFTDIYYRIILTPPLKNVRNEVCAESIVLTTTKEYEWSVPIGSIGICNLTYEKAKRFEYES